MPFPNISIYVMLFWIIYVNGADEKNTNMNLANNLKLNVIPEFFINWNVKMTQMRLINTEMINSGFNLTPDWY